MIAPALDLKSESSEGVVMNVDYPFSNLGTIYSELEHSSKGTEMENNNSKRILITGTDVELIT